MSLHACLRHVGEKLSEQPFIEMLSALVVTAICSVLPDGFGGSLFQGAALKAGLSTADARYTRLRAAEAALTTPRSSAEVFRRSSCVLRGSR